VTAGTGARAVAPVPMLLGDARPQRTDGDRIILAAGAALIVLVTLLLLAPIGGPLRRQFDRTLTATDYRAFYCGALLARTHENPYLTAPLEQCEEYRAPAPGVKPGTVKYLIAAPQPGYDFALLAPVTFVPFYTGAILWDALLAFCLLLSAWLLARIAALPMFVVLAAFSITDGLLALTWGQFPPIVIAALCLSAHFLQRERWATAAIAASFSMLVPHVGLPACAALFLWQPQARLPLLAAAAALAGLSLYAVGPAGNALYFLQVLPVQQLSELGDPIQYSLTWLLHQMQVPDSAALRAGSVNYLVMLGLSVGLAGRVARAFESRIPLVLFPPAAALFGGPYIHLVEISVALPFALYAAGRAPAHRGLAWAAVALLAVPWPPEKFIRYNALEVVVIVSLVAYVARERTLAIRAGLSAAALCAYLGFAVAVHGLPSAPLERPGMPQAAAADRANPNLAATQAALFRRQIAAWRLASWQTVAGKVPTWLGLGLLFGLAVSLAVDRAPLRVYVRTTRRVG
jgi:hypothetical protein